MPCQHKKFSVGRKFRPTGFFLALLLLLAGCAAPAMQPAHEYMHPLAALAQTRQRFPSSSPYPTPAPVFGGHFRHAVGADTPPQGIFNPVFQNSSVDGAFSSWFTGGNLLSYTPENTIGQHGVASWEMDKAAKTITLTMQEYVYWHDGTPLTLCDVVFAIETIATPGYAAAGGIRFTYMVQNIQGVWEFHRGEADYIAGLVLSPCGRQLTYHFVDFNPSLLHFGFWATPYPRHIFEGVPIHLHSTHYHTRVRPIGWGPFIVNSVAPGESMHLVRNENFWAERPFLDEVTVQIVPTAMVATLMEEGFFHMADFRLQDFADFTTPQNFHYIGDVTNVYNVVAFNLGWWDKSAGKVRPHQNPRMGCRYLRRALAYAVDEYLLTQGFFYGLRFPATSIIPPGHIQFICQEMDGFPYNPTLAKQLLDHAGWLPGEDGWRTFPCGAEFVLDFVTRSGEDWPIIAQHYAQAWRDIGINVAIRSADFTDIIANMYNADNWPWDVHIAGWSTGANPNPNLLWGHTAANRSRYMNPRLESHLALFNSEDAWDINWLVNHYQEWQQLFHYYIPAFPTNWRISLTAVNNYVHGLYIGHTKDGIRSIGGRHRIFIQNP
ncbi:MAG: ABC transporter substrate-binding protein [Defluviitaleaceae bacterium]|nr:ABC transporter substrate-binding protein [Defluviitaleaceae bacterium]